MNLIDDYLSSFVVKQYMNTLNSIMKRIREWFLLTAITFLLHLVLWIILLQEEFDWNSLDLLKNFVYCGAFIFSSMTVEFFLLRKKAKQNEFKYSGLILNGILTLALNLVIALIYETYISYLLWPDSYDEDVVCSAYIFCIIASLVSQFHVSRYYIELLLRRQKENENLMGKVLKSQLNPHFVFNSLNILAELIDEDPVRAENYTLSLSKIYRYIISSLEKDTVSISEAMIFTNEYVSILQNRFLSSIFLEIDDFDYDSNEKILTMSMQLLIENAVKHNCPSQTHPLEISIFRNGDYLVVSNTMNCDIQNKSMVTQPNGLGLNNLKLRYSMICGKEPIINITGEENHKLFEVLLPIIK